MAEAVLRAKRRMPVIPNDIPTVKYPEEVVDRREKNQKRKLGTLEGKMSVTFANDFAMTDEELVNL